MKGISFRIVVFLSCCFSVGYAQTEAKLTWTVRPEVQHSGSFRFYLLSETDTLENLKLDRTSNSQSFRVHIPSGKDSLTGVFAYSDNRKEPHEISYSIVSDQGLKRVEIELLFVGNAKKQEFLQDFTVNKFYTTDCISLQPAFNLRVGEQPLFKLVNRCDTTFYGYDPVDQYYGYIRMKYGSDWLKHSGSYCTSTIPQKPLQRSDTVYSWIPHYNSGDVYSIARAGVYRYVVSLCTETSSNGIPVQLIELAQTRIRTRIIYEAEMEFRVE